MRDLFAELGGIILEQTMLDILVNNMWRCEDYSRYTDWGSMGHIFIDGRVPGIVDGLREHHNPEMYRHVYVANAHHFSVAEMTHLLSVIQTHRGRLRHAVRFPNVFVRQ